MPILPTVTPPIKAYPGLSNLLSILWNHKDDVSPWFNDRFVQVVSVKDLDGAGFFGCFYDELRNNKVPEEMSCPFIEMQLVFSDSIYGLKDNELADAFRFYIDNGNYIYTYLDNFYIPAASSFSKYHYMHPTFIYGYDKDVFYVADFFKGVYTLSTIAEDQLNASRYFKDVTDRPLGDDYREIKLMKYIPHVHAFDLGLFLTSLNDYVECKDSFRKYCHEPMLKGRKVLYGIDYYKGMIDDIEHLKEGISHRQYHFISEHKNAMLLHLDYLHDSQYLCFNDYNALISECQRLRDRSEVLRNMIIKNNMKPNDPLRSHMVSSINEMQVADKVFSEQLLSCLHEYMRPII